jgi:hypothetical protein
MHNKNYFVAVAGGAQGSNKLPWNELLLEKTLSPQRVKIFLAF